MAGAAGYVQPCGPDFFWLLSGAILQEIRVVLLTETALGRNCVF
jgi:hypothetical protein